MIGLQTKIGKAWKNYLHNEGGQMAVITAMVGLPLILFVGYALDINNAVGKKSHISSALDTAALAAVIPANMDDEERSAYAQEVFDENYVGGVPITLSIAATRERVDIHAEAFVPTLFGGVVGMDNITVNEISAAVLTKSDVVCVLALDPTGERAIEFKDQAIYSSPACSVQVNSTNNLAIVSDVLTPPVAKSFCVGGLSRGAFSPYIKHACSPIADPYANLTPPEDGPCQSIKFINKGTTVLAPGTYCNGLRIQSGTIEFQPGVYIVKSGRLEFRKGVVAVGNDVTFVLKEGAHIEIEKDANVTLKAPGSGPYAGLVFYQVPNIPKVGKKPDFPTGTSTITSGGGLSLIGTAYLPSHTLMINSDSPVASQSPATSFIAYRLQLAGKSNTQVHVDHEAGGIPPMLPRSDESARLVSTNMPSNNNSDDDDD